MKNNKGFTLIELLVVIAVIGLLASVIMVSLNSARSKAQDAKIRAELNQVQIAMEMYYDQYGTYMVSGSGYQNGGQGWFNFQDGVSYVTAVSAKLTQLGMLGAMPLDNVPNYMIYLCNNNQQYSVTATLANPTSADTAKIQTLCLGSDVATSYGKNYGVGN
jgi:prepilin-type N-terminal cleavage/methylation domain-containing protein